ncbi:phosphoglycerate dehydrogenase [Ketobacter sp. MCCC 1A13808]|uniref:phosphoglycerate dehydrogenase n=1 Tax=Ketobacter sp. MCCC 1A13808 TaxID=2602738 RepID=UPI0012EB81B8|nr:phosphoglycerate dehydrogenase [Ketobacter sp. MCCC 1A13808]MVF12141.1 phosphoglycerate dehydrogenase [Ketobacter sp. MCCC 1A13808]
MFKVKTYNQISVKGLERFPRADYEVGSNINHPDGILLRSHKLHNEALAETVLCVARAGAGVNNIPLEQYTQRGVVVFNTPGANANAVKELVLAGLLLGSRGVLTGIEYVQSLNHLKDAAEMSKLLEAEKKRFAGNELYGSTLGVVGLGAIGSMVAEMALALGMKVVGYDPALSVDAAWRLPNRVERMENLHSLLSRADYITLHVPALDATKDMINHDTLQSVKPGARLLNFARDAIVHTAAIVDSLESEQGLGMYICDFPEPRLMGRNDVVAMPHIGASTAEAEENCAVMAADQLMEFIQHGNIKNSVNFPAVNMPRAEGCCRITFTNDNVSGVLGNVLSIFTENNVNVIDMMNKSRGNVAYNILDVESMPNDTIIDRLRRVEHVISVRVLPE